MYTEYRIGNKINVVDNKSATGYSGIYIVVSLKKIINFRNVFSISPPWGIEGDGPFTTFQACLQRLHFLK
jgi:hypothetical protein